MGGQRDETIRILITVKDFEKIWNPPIGQLTIDPLIRILPPS